MHYAEGLEAHISNIDQQQRSGSKFKQALGRIGLALGITIGGTIGAVGYEIIEAPKHVAVADTGGYPDADAVSCPAFGQYSWCKNGSDISSRGFGYRNCTDWAAYRSSLLTGVKVPYGQAMGHAKTWDDNGAKYFTVDSTPEPGDIAQSDTGYYGHVGVVEGVTRDGTGRVASIDVAEYNRAGFGEYWRGTYSADSRGNFWRNGAHTAKWDHFIDLNGTGKGIGGSSLTSGSFETEPAIVARGNGALNIFYKDTNSRLMGIGWDATTSWNHGNALTGSIVASNPSAVSRDPMKMEVFFRDVNNNLDNVGWSADKGWYPFVTRVADGSVAGDPEVISRTPDSMEVFYRNKQGNLMAIGWTALRGWSAPATIVGDGRVAGNPVAVARSEAAMEVLFRDRFGNLEDVGWDASIGWMSPQVRAYGMAGDPAAISRTPTSLDVFYRTSSNGVGEAYWDARFGWQGQFLGDNIVSDPAVVARSEGEIELLYRSVNSQLMSRGWNAVTGWSRSNARFNNMQGNPSAVGRGRYDMDVATKVSGNYLADTGWSADRGWAVTLPPTGENVA